MSRKGSYWGNAKCIFFFSRKNYTCVNKGSYEREPICVFVVHKTSIGSPPWYSKFCIKGYNFIWLKIFPWITYSTYCATKNYTLVNVSNHWCVTIPKCGYMEHRLAYLTFYVQWHIASFCETHLLCCSKQSRKCVRDMISVLVFSIHIQYRPIIESSRIVHGCRYILWPRPYTVSFSKKYFG